MKPIRTHTVINILKKTGLSFLLLLFALLLFLWGTMFVIAHGPSTTMRNLLVGMALQSGGVKFLPYTVLSVNTINEILAEDAQGITEVYDPSDAERYVVKIITNENGERIEVKVLVNDDGSAVITDENGNTEVTEYDEWEYAIDGIQFITVTRSNFKAYMLIIRDPSRVYLACASDFTGEVGKNCFEIAEQENAVATINAGLFSIAKGEGRYPIGLTYSGGKCVWNDGNTGLTFIGFDTDNKLIVSDTMTKSAAEKLNIRDGVTFQVTENSCRLIYTDENGSVHVSSSSSVSPAQRSAIGQRADGAVIFLATDGRSASSIGASYNDVTQLMYEYGAVTAGMLDGGTSSQMFYANYAELYNYDKSTLNEYQLKGLVNNYVAGALPRKVPTHFVVASTN